MAWRITNKGRLDSVNFCYDVTITVDRDGGHHPSPAEFALAAQQAASARAASIVKARSYSETIWKPALVKAGVIAEPAKDRRGRRRYVTTRREGIHQLRHYYASVMLAEASPSRSSLNTSATATRPSSCASTPTCCRALTTAPARSSASVSPG
jgi:hypothetical protein